VQDLNLAVTAADEQLRQSALMWLPLDKYKLATYSRVIAKWAQICCQNILVKAILFG
jgi:hypothetical protein